MTREHSQPRAISVACALVLAIAFGAGAQGRHGTASASSSTPATPRFVPASMAELTQPFVLPADWITENASLNPLFPRVPVQTAIEQWMQMSTSLFHCYRAFVPTESVSLPTLRDQIRNLHGTVESDDGQHLHGVIGSANLSVLPSGEGTTSHFQLCISLGASASAARLAAAARAVPLISSLRGLLDIIGSPSHVQYSRAASGRFGVAANEETSIHAPTSSATWARASAWLRGHGFVVEPPDPAFARFLGATATSTEVFTWTSPDHVAIEVQSSPGGEILITARRESRPAPSTP